MRQSDRDIITLICIEMLFVLAFVVTIAAIVVRGG
jgi:hypothetical protein